MDESAIRKATAALENARHALRDLELAETFPGADRAWSEFLVQTHRVFLKLKEGTKGDGRAEAWYGRIANQRKNDPLLQYLHHARNSDEHSLEEVKPPITAMSVEPPEITKPGFQTVTLTVQLDVIGHLAPVIDRDVHYGVPNEHLGQFIRDPTPISVGHLALAYLANLIEDAKGYA